MTGFVASTDPAITIVMPVYNALPFLDEAIASIVAQTFRNFRLAIYDDHSTDGSHALALAWAERDPRISVVRGERRLGPCGSSQAAAALAGTEFVARMDADDVAKPDRIEAQLDALGRYPQAVLVGSVFDMIDADSNPIFKTKSGYHGGKNPPIAHSSIVYRRTAFEAIGGYRENTEYFEDFDLYCRLYRIGEIAIVNRPLVKIRYSGRNMRLRDGQLAVLTHVSRLYDPGSKPGKDGRSLSPMAFYSISNLAMMSSVRPHLLGLMARKVRFERPSLTLLVAAAVLLGETSPRFARLVWRATSALRGWFRASPENVREVYLWAPPEQGVPPGNPEAAPAHWAKAA